MTESPAPTREAGRRHLGPEDLWAIPIPSDPQLSPDGRRVAFVRIIPDRARDGYRSTIWLAAVDTPGGGGPEQLTAGPDDGAPRWSPDGRCLAFVRPVDGAPQVHLLRLGAGEAVALTSRKEGAGEPVWSPDGTMIAFAALVDLDGDDEHAPVVVSRLDYKADGVGLLKGQRRHLFVLEVGGASEGDAASTAPAAARQVTFGDWSASTPVWAPAGDRLAFSASCGRDRDLRPESLVYSIAVSGGLATPLSPAGGVYTVTDWSPDGRRLLIVGQETVGPGGDHLFTLPATGGRPAPLAPGLERSVAPGGPGYPGAAPCFRDEGREVLFCSQDRGLVHLLAVPSDGGEPVPIVGGDRVVSGLSSTSGRIAFIAASPASPGEVWVLADRERVLTDLFAPAVPDARPAVWAPLEFTARDGTPIQGWLLRDEVAAGADPGPLLLDIHGGPHNSWRPVLDTSHLYHHALVADGWAVLVINPRASDGYGDAFRTATVGAWGTADEGDFVSALDEMVRRGVADPGRIAVTGYSYGGYMSCWLSARTDRFAAAVPGGCVTDLVSHAGTSDVGLYLTAEEMAASVAGPRGRLVASSPLTYVAGVATPTLLLHAEEDRRCPVGQAEQWFAALRERQVPVELVRYPGQSHLFILDGRPSHRADYARRLVAWVTEHTAPGARRSADRVPARRRDLVQRLEDLTARHGVPGASLAVLAAGEVVTAAAGVANLQAGVTVTPESVFQIGSISKVYTATLAMQLVDEGQVDLDGLILDVLPGFRVADSEVTKALTLRHLLTHTSGIQGDHFPDLGRGDDAVARFVASCAELGQSHPLGATMSYCNAGFVIVGGIIEHLTATTWDRALAARLLAPLGLGHTMTLPEEVLRFRGAMGHVVHHGSPPAPARSWGLPRSVGPAGLICATAADVLAFARMHLDGGTAADGTAVLSQASVAAMQHPQVAAPDPYTLGSHWGLGWILFDWGGRRVVGHDGNTLGQSAYLRVVPDRGVAVALLTNGGNAQDLFQDLMRPLLAELAGVVMPERPSPPAEPVAVDLDRHVGVYERLGTRMEIDRRGDGLLLRSVTTGPLAEVQDDPVAELELVAVEPDLFVTRHPGTESWIPVVFYRLTDGSPYMHFGARATPKVR